MRRAAVAISFHSRDGMGVAPLPYPALHASHSGIWIADADGTRPIGRGEAIRIAADTPVIVLNGTVAGPDASGLTITSGGSTVRGLFIIFPVRVSAWFFLGFWFLYQLFEASFGLYSPGGGGGVAFFAHVGGFVFGMLVTLALVNAGRLTSRSSAGVPTPT